MFIFSLATQMVGQTHKQNRSWSIVRISLPLKIVILEDVKTKGQTGYWLHNLYASTDTITVTKSRRMIWTGHVARVV